ncbi:MAG TPA: DinB family protein [Anaerolineaceae bacterium]
MTHPLVTQLRFTRREFIRGLDGLSAEDARKRVLPANAISWNVGHLAWQEQRYFLMFGMGRLLLPQIQDSFHYGAPASTPPLADMVAAWQEITRATDPWLDAQTVESLQQHVIRDGEMTPYFFGSLIQRVIYHYWYHTGENMGIRQALGHTNLPEFVGDLDEEAPYTPESAA